MPLGGQSGGTEGHGTSGVGGGPKNKDKDRKNNGGLGALGFDRSGMRPENAPVRDLSPKSQKSITDTDRGTKGTGGQSPALMNSKYPTAVGQTDPSADLTVGNIGQVIGKMLDITNPMGAAAKIGLESITGMDLPTLDDEFEGMGAPVPSVGAGHAQGSDSDLQAKNSQLADSEFAPPPAKKKKNAPLGNQVGTLLADAGGTLVAG